MSQNPLLVLAACVASFSLASAQSLNIDVGVTFPVPSSTFGAAAAQPGVWNSVDAGQAGATALVDLAGVATGVTIQRSNGSGSEMSWNNPGTNGDDAALMDDGDDPGLGSTWRISGLAAGDYEVTVYAWAPDDPGYQTVVYINGGASTIVGGGAARCAWPLHAASSADASSSVGATRRPRRRASMNEVTRGRARVASLTLG